MSNAQLNASVSAEALIEAADLTAEQLAQVAAERAAFAGVAASEGEANETEQAAAFRVACEALEAAHAANAAHKAAGKPESDAERDATRQAAWAMIDAIAALNDPDTRTSEGERMALAIATARGVSEKALAVYRQRGRDCAAFLPAIVKEGEPHKVTRGERKGEMVSGRLTKDPLTIAKRIRADGDATQERVAEYKDFRQAAKEMLAARMGRDVSDIEAALELGGDKELSAAMNAAVETVKAQRGALLSFRATLETLATMDANAQRAAAEMFGAFVASVGK